MPQPPNSQAILEETIERVEAQLRLGFGPPWMRGSSGAIHEAGKQATRDGWVASAATFRTRYDQAIIKHREPDWSLYRPAVYQHPEPEIIASPPSQDPSGALVPEGSFIRVAVIGDCHDDPRLPDKSRFHALGAWAAAQDVSQVVQLGDWGTWDSMSQHQKSGTLGFQENPSFMQDLESLYESIWAFEKGVSSSGIKKIMTSGNHEDRVRRYEDNNPQMAGTLDPKWRAAFAEHGWSVRNFGEYYFVDGVGFIHHAINGAGRAFGGKTANQRSANEAVFSIVHGHDHRLDIHSSPKIGPVRPVQIMSAGCALPWGHIEAYARHGTTGWWWGAVTVTILQGEIIGYSATSMIEIMDRFAPGKRSPIKAKTTQAEPTSEAPKKKGASPKAKAPIG